MTAPNELESDPTVEQGFGEFGLAVVSDFRRSQAKHNPLRIVE